MTSNIIVSLVIVASLFMALGILRLRRMSLQSLVFIISGTIIGLLLGALASVPLSKLPQPAGSILPILISIVLTVVAVSTIWARRSTLLHLMPFLGVDPTIGDTPSNSSGASILVDTSVIIDGRIADIAVAGFIPGRLLVPRFVLAELQNIADSEDAMRRGRGRRGLEVLNRLRETKGIEVEVIEDDVASIKEVDAKLVALSLKFGCDVLTTDYNLNRVAQIQGVRVLNINELANAIRPVVLPGEEMLVRVVQPGKEKNQGVGYLADGTMIVVENGDKLIGQEVSTEVTRVFQTVAGKMIFATPRKDGQAISLPAADIVLPELIREVPASLAEHTAKKHKPKQPDKPVAPKPAVDKPVADKAAERNGNHRSRNRRGSKPAKISSIEDSIIEHTGQ